MKVESIKLKNFKAFKSGQLTNLPSLCVLVGANGTGKSTLFDVFGFLRDCLTYNVTTALQSRGGFDEVLSRGADEKAIEIELQCRFPVAGTERLVSYCIRVGQEHGKAVVDREVLRYNGKGQGAPYHLLDFSGGKGYAVLEEGSEKEHETLDKPDILAIKGLGQFQRFRAASAFRQLMEAWHISDFQVNLARGSKAVTGYSEHLSASGDNLQLVARRLSEEEPEVFAKIIQQMNRRVPGIDAIETEQTQDGRILLKFRDGSFENAFTDKWVSGGTLTMFAYLVLLYDPSPHPLLFVEEPEAQLYPTMLWELAEEFRAYTTRASKSQVFVSTHSPDFLNAVQVDEVFWLAKQAGCTEVRRANEDKQVAIYMKEGDQMGYLWTEGLFPGVNP